MAFIVSSSILLLFLLSANGQIFTHDRKRPVPILDSNRRCLERFEVSESTIIRAQDSLKLGAQLLNDTETGNREDCMALCCTTPRCSVAVFEERNNGSCFLFNCGTTDNFMCRFTTHSFYTSTKLREPLQQTVVTEAPPASPPTSPPREGQQEEQRLVWMRPRSQHEEELHNLRSSNVAPHAPQIERSPFTMEGVPKQTMQRRDQILPPQPHTTVVATTLPTTRIPVTKGRQCSRYQFECHSGECIAIYNACDGIPQCRDGSDETAALKCPSAHTGIDAERSLVLQPKPPGARERIRVEEPRQAEYGGEASPLIRSKEEEESKSRQFSGSTDRGVFTHHPTLLDGYSKYNVPGAEGVSGYSAKEDSAGYGGRGKGPGYYDYSSRGSYPSSRYGNTAGVGEYDSKYSRNDYPDYSSNVASGIYSPGDSSYSQTQSQHNPSLWSPNESNRLPLYLQNSANNLQQQNGGSSQRYYYNPMASNSQQPQQAPQQLLAQRTRLQMPSLQQQQQQQYIGTVKQPGKMYPVPREREPSGYQTANGARIGGIQGNGLLNAGEPRLKPTILNNSNGNSGRPNLIPVIPNSHPAAKPEKSNEDSKPSSNSSMPQNTNNVSLNSSKDSQPIRNETTSASSNSTSSSLLESMSILGPWKAMVSKWKLDPSEVEAERRESEIQISGAIAALSLGIVVSSMLIVLIMCRLRGLRRRRHRGGRSPFAHDADYLVNGMYL